MSKSTQNLNPNIPNVFTDERETSKQSKNLDKTISRSLKNFINTKINDLTRYYGINYNPFVNGKYMIFMINGPWYNKILSSNNKEVTGLISNLDFFKNPNDYSNVKNYSTQNGMNNVFHYLATDIDIPEPSKEYLNVSTRSQTITHYQREILMPDFNISYIENDDMFIIRYHELWHKTIELYRRGKIPCNPNDIQKNNSYFYNVPYANSVFVLIFDIKYQIRGVVYLVGIKPVSMPLKQVLGNRSGSKMGVYNIQYKLTNMYYKFFKNTLEFQNYQTKDSILSTIFTKNILNTNSDIGPK